MHDELLFIIVHQAYELWFRQLLFELEAIRDRLFDGDTERARHYLVRVKAIERVLIEQIDVLRSMSPQDFLAFRSLLTPASGFQSVQFREVEFVSGLKDERYLDDLAASSEDRARLARRLEEPTVWDGFVALLERHGLAMPPGDPEGRTASLVTMARDRPELFAVSEGLLDHDEGFADLEIGARAHGRAADRRQTWHGRLERGRLSARHPRQAVLPRALGAPQLAVAPGTGSPPAHPAPAGASRPPARLSSAACRTCERRRRPPRSPSR